MIKCSNGGTATIYSDFPNVTYSTEKSLFTIKCLFELL